MTDKPATMKKKKKLLRKIFNLPQTANAKKKALEAMLKNDVPINIQTPTLKNFSLIDDDKGHQPVDDLIIGSRIVLYHKDQGWVTATLIQRITKKSQSKTTKYTRNCFTFTHDTIIDQAQDEQIYQENFCTGGPWVRMIQDGEDIVPMAEDELTKLFDICLKISSATNNARFIS